VKLYAGLCCSKKIVWTSWGVFVALLCALLYGLFFTEKDMTPLVTVLCFDGGVTGTATAFYFWKARTENRLKLTKSMVEDWAGRYGIDSVVNLAGIIFNE
jgi:hypothetical protein